MRTKNFLSSLLTLENAFLIVFSLAAFCVYAFAETPKKLDYRYDRAALNHATVNHTAVNNGEDTANPPHANKKRYIVELNAPSVGRHLAKQLTQASTLRAIGASHGTIASLNASSVNRSELLSSPSVASYVNDLSDKQFALSAKMQQRTPAIDIGKTYQTVFNGFAVSAFEQDIDTLRKMPEVKRIYPDLKRYVHLDTSHQLINTESVWQQVGGQQDAGKGIKIAIIDSGIRIENPMFSDEGMMPVDLSDNEYLSQHPDYCRAVDGDANFCNNKVILARWVNPTEHDFFGLDAGEHFSPLGLNRHGSHVAGIAAGNPVSIEFTGVPVDIAGVAPGAYLMVYKALYSSHGSTFGTDSMLLEALEHAVNDGADVINNSWGSFSGEMPENSVYANVFADAEALGIAIVNSAGNAGRFGDSGSINCPGCIESGITVANTMHGRFFGHKLSLSTGAEYIALQGEDIEPQPSVPPFDLDPGQESDGNSNTPALTEDLHLTLRSFSELGASANDGCEYSFDFPTFENAAVLVDYRDNCSMEAVVENAQAAGGKAVIVYQSSVSDASVRAPFEPFRRDYALPVLGVSRATGLDLFDSIGEAFPSITIVATSSAFVDPEFSETLNLSSSRGPNNNPHVLKPDVAAPGTFVLSASAPPPVIDNGPFGPPPGEVDLSPRYTIISGTSMSSPHVAGAVALIKQLHPDWTPAQIKSAIITTANTNITSFDKPADAFSIGGGRLDIQAAVNAKLAFKKASFADPACIGRCTATIEIQNLLDEASQWQLSVVFDNIDITTTLNTEEISFASHGQHDDTQSISVEFDTSSVDDSAWLFGLLYLRNGDGYAQHVPLAVFANDNTDTAALSTSADLTDNGGEIPVSVKVRNIGFTENPQVEIKVPDNAQIIEQSQSVTELNGQTDTLIYNPTENKIEWAGSLSAGNMALVPELPWDGGTLASLGIAPVLCENSCVTFSRVMDFNFEFYGEQYSSIAISSNGFALPGANNINPFAVTSPQQFPKQDNLNNVLAPLWADYDYKDPNNPDDLGGGFLRTAIHTIEGINYLIAEWDGVQVFGFDEFEGEVPDTYSFQLIIQENTDNIWFNYLSIPSMPLSASIGAESADALVGVNYYFRGEGNSIPNNISDEGFRLKLESRLMGEANIQFEISLADNQDSTSPDEQHTQEDTSVLIDVLSNDSGDANVKIDAHLDAGATYDVARLIKIRNENALDPTSLEIVNMPAHGQTELVNDSILYQPNANFYGQDIFSYKVATNEGNFSKATKVTIQVLPINDAPEIDVDSRVLAFEGESTVLTVTGTDAEQDELTYEWEQTSGLIIPLTIEENTLRFTAPLVSGDRIMNFTVSASDGNKVSETKTIQVLVVDSRKGGSVGWYVFIILTVLLTIRYSVSRRH